MPTGTARPSEPHHVVIIGAGFGGMAAAKALVHASVRVTVIDRRNHHLFQPLLYQVATAGLSPADIAQPIRSLLKKNANTEVILDDVTGVDTTRKIVSLKTQRALSFDSLILATGSQTSYFGNDEWRKHSLSLKNLEDAMTIRSHILGAFEKAESEPNAEKRETLMTFVLIGGGPTGVEMAGAMSELAKLGLRNNFRHIDPASARIILIEAGARILPSFPEDLSAQSLKALQAKGVDVRLNQPVKEVTPEGIAIQQQFIRAHTVIWTAGVAATPIASWLNTPTDRSGRISVNSDLSLSNHPNIFVIGDAASVIQDGHPLPGVAPVAMQQGRYVGQLIAAKTSGHIPSKSFRYINKGNLATIGRAAAIADFGLFRLSGLPAWIFWIFIHIWYLNGFRNRLIVMLQWLWAYVTFQGGARLMTYSDKS